MANSSRPQPEEVEQLLRNAQLRDELEPFYDESILRIEPHVVPVPVENEYLASMLAWEKAPVLPIARWFDPELRPPLPETLDDDQLHRVLWETIARLHAKRVVLAFTDHLSDRQLYALILRDILPSEEKKIEGARNYLCWDCAGVTDDPDTWLRYYATDEERSDWQQQHPDSLPPRERPPYPRQLPGAPA